MGRMLPLPRGDDPYSKQLRRRLIEDQARADAYGCVGTVLLFLAVAGLAVLLRIGGVW